METNDKVVYYGETYKIINKNDNAVLLLGVSSNVKDDIIMLKINDPDIVIVSNEEVE